MKGPIVVALMLVAAGATLAEQGLRFQVRVKRPIAGGGGSITTVAWSQITPTATNNQFPAWTAYSTALYDSVSGTTLWYNNRSGSGNIYSTDLWTYTASTTNWYRIGGTGASDPRCTDGSGSTDVNGNPKTPWPTERHPSEGMAIDTVRNHLHLILGVCNQGILTYTHWRMSLNATPSNNAWTLVHNDTAAPPVTIVPNTGFDHSMAYAPSEDLLVLHGRHETSFFPRTWVYCLGSGAPTSEQTAAGCTNRNTWYEVYADPGPSCCTPPQSGNSQGGSLVYASVTSEMLLLGHGNSGPASVWKYNIQAKTWGNESPSNPPTEGGMPAGPEDLVDYVTSGGLAGKIYYRQTGHDSVPATSTDWYYDPQTNAWTQLTTQGTGPRTLTFLAFDPNIGSNGGVVAFDNGAGLWHGVFQ